MNRGLLCTLEERDGRWEAICLDLDIAVAADTFDDALRDLEQGIRSYIEAAGQEAPADRERLMSRSAPISLRVKSVAKFLLLALTHRADRHQGGGSFILPCHV